MHLLMIGCGKMGGALLGRWTQHTQYSMTIVDPALTAAPASVTLKASVEDLEGKQFDIVVIAIKPQLIKTVLPAYQKLIAKVKLADVSASFVMEEIKETTQIPLSGLV